MNAELQRQHAAHKDRRARMSSGLPPACRAILSPWVRSAILDAREEHEISVEAGRRAQLEKDHRFRVTCIAEVFESERRAAREEWYSLLPRALLMITQRETEALIGEQQFYLMELHDAARVPDDAGTTEHLG